ncbi:MAG: Na/Pi symporter, partial [Clostridia bacterium]|nr:Na/Pi symporter [Clostridia bacterium]
MGVNDVLMLIGGLALFLFGMKVMGDALEKRAGNQMKSILGKMTSNRLKGFLLGAGVTAIIQSSSATTVMVVGFVNSGIMTLKQSIGVIMGANLGTSITSWLLALTGIEGDSLWVSMLKPSSFTPILAIIGVFLYAFQKNKKRSDIGLILLGFAVLMFGMDLMSDSVNCLQNNENFT